MNRDLISFWGLTDPVSALTHALAGVVVFGAFLLVRERTRGLGDRRRRVGLQLFPLLIAVQHACSAVYHALPDHGLARELFWHLDHATIWIALAGGATSTHAAFCAWNARYLSGVWALAFMGAAVELTSLPEIAPWICPLLYVGMGWAAFPTWLEATRRHGLFPPGWLMLGGLSATLGGFMDAAYWPTLYPGYVEAHELMHVLSGLGGWLFAYGVFQGAVRLAGSQDAWIGAGAGLPVPALAPVSTLPPGGPTEPPRAL